MQTQVNLQYLTDLSVTYYREPNYPKITYLSYFQVERQMSSVDIKLIKFVVEICLAYYLLSKLGTEESFMVSIYITSQKFNCTKVFFISFFLNTLTSQEIPLFNIGQGIPCSRKSFQVFYLCLVLYIRIC